MLTPIRKTVRIILLNDKNELLLMYINDFDISTPDGTKNNKFWCTIGGAVEEGESVEQAALREIYEETGIAKENVTLGPVVWHSTVELVLKGRLTCFDELYMVAITKQTEVSLHVPTEDERQCVKMLKWFSLDDICNSDEIIFPLTLSNYLPAILLRRYPEEPINING